MKPLPNDVSRCDGEDCKEKETCMRYLSIALDSEQGRYTFSFFDHHNCTIKIEAEHYEKTN